MSDRPVYMDNQATTRVDPQVVEAMAPWWTEHYGNPGSVSHAFGWEAKEAVDDATNRIAAALGARPREIIYTSGATESNNLALMGAARHHRRRGNHIVSVVTEHKSVLDPLARLASQDFEVTLLDVAGHAEPCPGLIDLHHFEASLRDDTALVSVMLANNEIGLIQPLAAIGRICKEHGILLHCDAAQAVGRIPLDVQQLQVDLLSFSGHKIYGPRGIGVLYVRRRAPHVRLEPLIFGGGQQQGLRSGTLNVPAIVGLAKAVELCDAELTAESERLAQLRQRLYDGIVAGLTDVHLNGPSLDDAAVRLVGNLNLGFDYVDGEALMMSMGTLAVSSGSACTSESPEPSHVLRALGLNDDRVRGSLRFGLGRFNTDEDVNRAVNDVVESVKRLRKLSSMAS
jgi:cysteine desulfurase